MSGSAHSKTMAVLSAGYSLHTKPFAIPYIAHMRSYLFRIQTEGRCRMLVDGVKTDIEAGDLLLYGLEEPYELTVDSDPSSQGGPLSGDYYIFTRGSWIDHWWSERKRPQKIRVSLTGGMITLFRQIVAEWNKTSADSDDILDHFMMILCRYIDRAAYEHPRQGQAYIAFQIRHFIEEHAASPFKLEEIASNFGISISRAVHLYKRVFGSSIMQYALDVRINMAKERILYSPMPLHYVAETSGFSSYTYFFRVFRKRFGMSPGQYRNEFGDF